MELEEFWEGGRLRFEPGAGFGGVGVGFFEFDLRDF